jgi:polyisoprenoid-binding protein YceI
MKNVTKIIPDGAVLIDLLSDSSFAIEHIVGAKNFCVYELAFLNKILTAYPDKAIVFCVYGWNDTTEEVGRAHKILTEAGYANLFVLEGGLETWIASGKKTEGSGQIPILDGEYTLNPSTSIVEWTGRKVGKKHVGSILITEGIFNFKNDILVSGTIVFDMYSIVDKDLTEYRDVLEGHLKSDDFFSIATFSETTLKISTAQKLPAVESKPNYNIKAMVTIRDISEEIECNAFVHERGGNMVLNTHFDIDRTRWGVKYGSAKYFSRLGTHAVDDAISFDLILFGEKR